MRTTIDIPDDLYREVEELAASRGLPLPELIEEALREIIDTPSNEPRYLIDFPILRTNKPGSISLEAIQRAQEQDLLDEDLLRGGTA